MSLRLVVENVGFFGDDPLVDSLVDVLEMDEVNPVVFVPQPSHRIHREIAIGALFHTLIRKPVVREAIFRPVFSIARACQSTSSFVALGRVQLPGKRRS